jgi:hypothetical protein
MSHKCYLGFFLVFLGMLSVYAAAQSDDGVSLGDLARSLRQSKEPKDPKEPAVPKIIDNDNLSQVIDQVENFRLRGKSLFSFDAAGRNFQVTSPDGTCSLSFNANSTALLSSPYVSQDLPQSELAKLDGPANIHDDTLEISVYNATAWNVKEITVGLTIVRRADPSAAYYGAAKLVPAVAGDVVSAEKLSDSTVLLHLKGSAVPLATTVFRQKLNTILDEGQEWHWAIVEAKGIPAVQAPGSSTDQSVPTSTQAN